MLKISQSRGDGVRKGKQSQFPEATKTLKAQDLVLGSLLFLTKAAPSPRFRINPFMKYSKQTGRIHIDSKTQDCLDKLDKLLLGKTDKDIDIFETEDDLDITGIEA